MFFGVDVTPELRDDFAAVQSSLQDGGVEAGNWSRQELFHLTLLFIGEVPQGEVEAMSELGRLTALEGKPFELSFDNLGMFERNRVLWYGLAEDSGLIELKRLYQVMKGHAAKKPFIRLDERPYSPHLTLARKLSPASMPTVRKVVTDGEAVPLVTHSLPVNSICLFESKRIAGQLAYPIVERFYFPSVEA